MSCVYLFRCLWTPTYKPQLRRPRVLSLVASWLQIPPSVQLSGRAGPCLPTPGLSQPLRPGSRAPHASPAPLLQLSLQAPPSSSRAAPGYVPSGDRAISGRISVVPILQGRKQRLRAVRESPDHAASRAGAPRPAQLTSLRSDVASGYSEHFLRLQTISFLNRVWGLASPEGSLYTRLHRRRKTTAASPG